MPIDSRIIEMGKLRCASQFLRRRCWSVLLNQGKCTLFFALISRARKLELQALELRGELNKKKKRQLTIKAFDSIT